MIHDNSTISKIIRFIADIPLEWKLFVFVFSVFFLLMNPSFIGYDVESYLACSNVFKRGSVSLDPDPVIGIAYEGGVPGRGGYRYSRSGAVDLLLVAPFYMAGMVIDSIVAPGKHWGSYFLSLMGRPFCAALCALLLYMIAGEFYRKRTAIIVSLGYSLSTMALVYSNIRVESSLAAALMTMTLGLIKSSRDSRPLWSVLAGIGAGAAIAIKSYAPVLILPAIVWQILMSRKKPINLLYFFVAALPFISLQAAYNLIRFSSVFNTGYGATFGFGPRDLMKCVYVLFLSPAKSVFIFCPLIIAGIFSLKSFGKKYPAFAIYIVAETILLALFISTFRPPLLFADEIWGSRYLFPAVWLLCIPAGEWMEAGGSKYKAVIALVVIGFLINLTGILIRQEAISQYSNAACADPLNCRLVDPAMNAVVFNVRLLVGMAPPQASSYSGIWIWWVQILKPSAVGAARLELIQGMHAPIIYISVIFSVLCFVSLAVLSFISILRQSRDHST